TADIVSIRVMDDRGVAMTSDVIAAADWILKQKDTYNIRVANFSLHSAKGNSFKFDPLDHAVERLWFSGVTVVAAAGNFSDGTPQNMYYAPANDPFVITVGAADPVGTVESADDGIAYWSAYGYTGDGFAKPELSAPGRYIVGAVPPAASLPVTRPEKVVAPGYMRLSGSSFAAPIVAGAAAQLLALRPEWGPDEVKGALMQAAQPLQTGNSLADGIGEIDLAAAARIATPANPNSALRRFVVADANVPGGLTFDAAAWNAAASGDPMWDAASFADASYADASFADASFADAYFASASYADASYADASFADASFADASYSDASYSDASYSDASYSDTSSADAASDD
ncbi:MAG: S8 family serine peptidase, partial [Actinomycetota bacterium]|nr:S8 family serine peptidase [Actinomycetota bacterium]